MATVKPTHATRQRTEATLPGPHATPSGVSAMLPDGAGRSTAVDDRGLDPRAVRVSLGPASAAVAIEPITVTPRDTSPHDPDAPVPGLHDQGTDPPNDGAALRHLDVERAVLSRPGAADARVLLLPLAPTTDPGAPARREVVVDGWRIEVELEPAARAALRARAHRGREEQGHSGPSEVRAIIPGVVVSVSVAPGDEVVAGQQLLAVEAMKMQNELRAPRDGVIERVAVGTGTTIEVGDLLLVIA